MTRTLALRLAGCAAVAFTLGALAPAPAGAQLGDWERMRCESQGRRETYCRASIGGDVRVRRQLSDTPCREGRNWRWDRTGIWVNDGCRAEFEFRRRGGGGGGGWGGSGGSGSGWGGGSGGGGWGGGGRREYVTCQSSGKQEAFCPAAIGGDVEVVRQMSDTDCVFGRTWNWTRNGVTVWNGCRAEFAFRPRGGELPPDGPRMARVTCQSQGGREDFCPAPIGGDVRVARNISDVRCREGSNWSWTNEGVRVWGGCRADFEYRTRR
jgi:hypothetical protein